MILLLGPVAGLLSGLGWARWRHRPYRAPAPRCLWLVFVAFLPQLVIAYLPGTRHLFPDRWAAISLLASLVLFGWFVWLNHRLPGMPVLLAGLIMNFTVILVNGGWMPIAPQTVSRLTQAGALQFSEVGSRFGQKDILLPPENTHLEFLADRFLPPTWAPYRVAFSLGDVLIAIGAFWLFARQAYRIKIKNTERVDP
jgi:uncharacterized protein DUF5317